MKRQRDLDRYLALLPAVVLCVVAVVHLWRWHREPLTSWRGGGMGMYADINDEQGRYLRVYVLRHLWEPAQVSERLAARVTNVRLNPSTSNIGAFADHLACSSLFLSQNSEARRIRLEYWEQEFESATYTVRMDKRLEVSREPCKLD